MTLGRGLSFEHLLLLRHPSANQPLVYHPLKERGVTFCTHVQVVRGTIHTFENKTRVPVGIKLFHEAECPEAQIRLWDQML
jgi:hypothetical protein